jgi:hypothetical protein
MIAEMPLLVSIQDVALELSVSAERCRRMVQKGTLKGQLVAGRYFVDRASLESWKAQRKTSAGRGR